jgi:hypothetical protein
MSLDGGYDWSEENEGSDYYEEQVEEPRRHKALEEDVRIRGEQYDYEADLEDRVAYLQSMRDDIDE